MKLTLPSALSLLLASTLVACSGSGGSVGTGRAAPAARTGMTTVAVGTVGDADLFALHADIESMRLVADDGTRTPNLLRAVTPLELHAQRPLRTRRLSPSRGQECFPGPG